MYRKTISALVVLAVTASLATAYDILPPVLWERGAEGTTLQIWEFNAEVNPVPPDVVENPFGDPLATIVGSDQGTDQFDPLWLAEDGGHVGVWRTGGLIQLYVPNAPTPNRWKWIWLQITYNAGNDYSPVIQTEPAWVQKDLVYSLDAGGGYKHDTYFIAIPDNPEVEWITILPAFCALYVDEIVVDTICIPEPAAVALISLGGVFLFRRRRR
jgi:hypothetical protein